MRHSQFYGAPLYIFKPDPAYRFEAGQALYIIRTLAALGSVALQIVARPQGIRWQAVDLSGRRTALSTLKLPQIAVQAVGYGTGKAKNYPFYRGKSSYTLYARANHPLVYIHELTGEADPLLPLSQSLSYLKEREEIRYTILVQRQHKPPLYQGLTFADNVLNIGELDRHFNTYEQVIRHKQNQPWYECFVGVDIDSPHFQRVIELRQTLNFQLSGAFDRDQANHPPNGLRARGYARIFAVRSREEDYRTQTIGWYARRFTSSKIADWWSSHWIYLTTSEIASLWHLPHHRFVSANVLWQKVRPSLPRPMAQHEQGIELGQALYQDELQPAHLDWLDRDTHATIIGRTGGGKSTFMHAQAHQDIQNGQGVLVIDPHGALVKRILQCSIPPEREADVVVLDLGQPDYPLPLNLFAGQQTYASVGRIVDIIEQVYTVTGVRMDKYLRAGIQALETVKDATMFDLFLLFTDEAYRANVLAQLNDWETRHTLHDEFHLLSSVQQRTIRGPILNRINPFFANPYLYPSLCHPHRLDLAELIQAQKIVLISLAVNGEKVPQKERNLVGALLISFLQMVGMNPEQAPVPFYVYIDEVQNFVTSALEVVFSEARKYGLSMTVAHQHFSQLATETLHGILGNVGTLVVFPTNAEDAQKLAPHLQPQFSVTDLVKMNRFQAAVKTHHQRQSQDAFLIDSPRPLPVPNNAKAQEERIRALSIAQYTPLTRQEVLGWLSQRYPKPPSVNDLLASGEDTPADTDLDYTQWTG